MSGLYLSKALFPSEFFRPTIDYIVGNQRADGSIPWFTGGYADPWDHTEAAMALSIAGYFPQAERAYYWLGHNQLEDGSWWIQYRNGRVNSYERRESNFVAYVATGVWHHYLITANTDFLSTMWPVVEKAIGFVLRLQAPTGEIYWGVDGNDSVMQDALITGCSSIYKSLECALNIASTLEHSRPEWYFTRLRLGETLRNHPECFDRTWESKERFSMDWFYPIMCGVYSRPQAIERIRAKWDQFVVKDLGCRCVSDEPWVTIAESCELTMALLAAGDHARAVTLYSWLHQWRAEDGSYWTGYQFEMDVLWPEEKPTWTAGAILLAADALTEHTAAAKLFTEVNILNPSQHAEGIDHGQLLKQS